MRGSVVRPMAAATVAVLLVSIWLVHQMEGPIWAGFVAWIAAAVPLLLIGVLIEKVRPGR